MKSPSRLEQALANTVRPRATDGTDTMNGLIIHYNNAWKSYVIDRATKNMLRTNGDSQERVLAAGYLFAIMESGNYNAIIKRDLKATDVEFAKIVEGRNLLAIKMSEAGTAPLKSITRTIYDRVRQVGR